MFGAGSACRVNNSSKLRATHERALLKVGPSRISSDPEHRLRPGHIVVSWGYSVVSL